MSDSVGGTKDEQIIREARKRLQAGLDREGTWRTLFTEDVKFGNADSDNMWQWPENVRASRELQQRPILTVNKTRQHCLQIINDARQNKPGVQIRPVGDGATFDAAQVFEGTVRHIEYISNAQQAYDAATWSQVFGGIGYWRVVTDYATEDSFDQEIFIRRIADPLSVVLDPDIREYDGSDARWAIVFEDISRDEAIDLGYVDKDEPIPAALDHDGGQWNNKDNVRVAEYFRVGEKTDELIETPAGPMRKSAMPPELLAMVPPDARRRPIAEPDVEWFKIAGSKIVDRKPWLGCYIPIVRCVGEETNIEGVLDRKGHVRALKDPQRMYNYNSSASVEYGALQSKTPYVGPVRAFESLETDWASANTVNHAYLAYNDIDVDGRPIERPKREQPPSAAPVNLEGMKVAESEMMMASGQYQAVMGSPSNETSGKAINARQRQGDNATYHFIDHQASAIRYTGKILIDLIPRVYDTARIVQIIARDGTRTTVALDPKAQGSHQQVQDPDAANYDPAKVAAIFNPNVGRYDVMSDIGPSYATQRQEEFNALSQIITQNPDLVHVVGDLMFKAADFPMADLIAERLKNMVPQQALGGPSAEMQQMQQHMQMAAQAGQEQIEQLHAALQQAKAQLADKSAETERQNYEAETKRMVAIGSIDPAAFQPVIRGLVSSALGTPIGPLMDQHAVADQARVPPPPPMQPQGMQQ